MPSLMEKKAMTHTPGPWITKQVHGLPDEDFIAVIGGEVEVCILPPSGEANARLIAAAPMLLEACEAALTEYMAGGGYAPNTREQLKAAIAQAKGESK